MLIIDMPMPPHCADCFLHMDGNWDDGCGFCAGVPIYMDDDCRPNYEKRPSWCPIKGVLPEEHGDLIDRDKIVTAYAICDGTEAMELIKEAAVIIAAERTEERKDDGRTDKA